ncbi:MAG: hypothetical protein HQL66_02740 [Magnetococcales bacterium]|nr:hypothetical protein [Magnetococcales bacterium]
MMDCLCCVGRLSRRACPNDPLGDPAVPEAWEDPKEACPTVGEDVAGSDARADIRALGHCSSTEVAAIVAGLPVYVKRKKWYTNKIVGISSGSWFESTCREGI